MPAWGGKKRTDLCVRMNRPGVREMKVLHWACVQSKTDISLPKHMFFHAYVSSFNNCPQLTKSRHWRGWMRQGKVETHGFFFPLTKVWHPPTPYPLEPCPFHSTLHCRSWLWFILFDVCVYMMPNYNVSDSTTYHRQLSLLPKHSQPNRWWGFFLELLTMINYIIYIMQTRSKPGCYTFYQH